MELSDILLPAAITAVNIIVGASMMSIWRQLKRAWPRINLYYRMMIVEDRLEAYKSLLDKYYGG